LKYHSSIKPTHLVHVRFQKAPTLFEVSRQIGAIFDDPKMGVWIIKEKKSHQGFMNLNLKFINLV